MFFSYTAWFLAVVICLSGLWLVYAGIRFGDDPALVSRYLGGGTPGSHIDKGIIMVLSGIALGTIAEMSLTSSRWKRRRDSQSEAKQ